MATVKRTLRAAKQAARKDLRDKLKKLTDEEKVRQSKIITQKLFSLEKFRTCQSLSIYLSMPTEVYTNEILKDIFATKKRCYIPHYVGDKMSMVLLKDEADYDSLPLTSWNIKQPPNDEIRECAIESGVGLDIIIVPGLGFTEQGSRLGRGKGYYDNYFRKYEEKFARKPFTIGLAYTCQMLDDVPADEFDVKLDHMLHA